MRTSPYSTMLVAACFWLPGSMPAAVLIFDDTSPNETITVFADGFGALFLNGALFQSGGLGHPVDTTLAETTSPITFSGTFDAPTSPDSAGARTLYLLEPNSTDVSDILDLSWTYSGHIASIRGSFISDAEGGSLGTVPAGVLPSDIFVENGTPVGHGMDFINIEVRSDVPDTGAFWMFPLALAPVLYFGRRLRAPA